MQHSSKCHFPLSFVPVLTHDIPGIFIVEKKDRESDVMSLEHTVAVICHPDDYCCGHNCTCRMLPHVSQVWNAS
jgi:hypothetical protein